MSERVVAGVGLLAPLVVVVAGLETACIPGTCTLIGCESAERLEVPLAVAREELESGRVSGCRNDQCWQGEITALNFDHTNGAVRPIELEPGFDEEGSVHASASIYEESDGSLLLLFHWRLDDGRDVERGDELRVGVLNAEGAEVAVAEGRVTSVSEEQPNGDGCEPICRTGHVDVR